MPYRFNDTLARAAVMARTHFVDLGGNNDVVARELALDELARKAGVLIVPDCGLAPGLVSVLTRLLVGQSSSCNRPTGRLLRRSA